MKIVTSWVKACFAGVGLWAVLVNCQSSDHGTQSAPRQLTPAFYHWKSTFAPTHSEIRQLKDLNVQKLYIHFFDVDWDSRTHKPIPKAFVKFRQKAPGSIVPVVFITNRTLLNLTPAALPELAINVSRSISRISQQNAIRFQEVQFDCDWSVSTRDRYFRLLTLLAKQLRCPLTATIRLHQIKYTDQTGIPPVSRGMLMLYNVADWKRADTRNSIYDAEIASQYLSFVPTYPLPLDVVLPLFRWTVVYRNNRFLTFLSNVNRTALAGSNFLAAQPDSMRFVALRDTAAWGLSIRPGDLFRAEGVTAKTLVNEKTKLSRQIRNQRITFALYHLDSTVLSAYSRETLKTLLVPHPLP
ncbi:hypothetical protein [Spirosoma pollinicola]|uniref:Uncharacterized protein n=1 Tax=Spirosoma pollinicola TaxID=2057025 RepID=A0A2K8YZ02_9BACT|nr:hypothetical protein [Spirosoma pollinicola]AUD02863.1 hypothetical protein CWM47_14090 [Spirosoma pollinicola]